MLSFRQKIVFTYVVIFLMFLVLLFPFTKKIVGDVVQSQLTWRANELIKDIIKESDLEVLIERLRERQSLFFTRVTLLDDKGGILYDSHLEDVLGGDFEPGYFTEHPEVVDALRYGVGHSEGYSHVLDNSFAYTAKVFVFHKKTFVMRTAFPLKQIDMLTEKFQFSFLIFGSFILALFGILTWLIIYNLSRPIHKIIEDIKPYQSGKVEQLPKIVLDNSKDDFAKLAKTLNSLSERIKFQIETLKNERNEKSKILETLSEGVIAVDEDLRVVFINSMAEKILDCEREQIIDKTLEIYEDELCQRCHHLLVQALQVENCSVAEVKGHNGSVLDITASQKDDGAILVLQDKTTNYRLMEMHRAFVANASHELKTPITIVQGFAEAMHDNPDLSNEKTVQSIEKIVKNCGRMSNLVRNLLTLSDIEYISESSLELCNIRDIVLESRDNLLEIYPDAEVKTDFVGSDELLCDPELLSLAIKNLMENAAKYSESSAKIFVSVREGNDRIILEISDCGIGIPEKDRDNIFHRFYTVNKSRTRKLGGAGLGLSIVENIVQKHKGKILVESEMGKGSTFIITLPKS